MCTEQRNKGFGRLEPAPFSGLRDGLVTQTSTAAACQSTCVLPLAATRVLLLSNKAKANDKTKRKKKEDCLHGSLRLLSKEQTSSSYLTMRYLNYTARGRGRSYLRECLMFSGKMRSLAGQAPRPGLARKQMKSQLVVTAAVPRLAPRGRGALTPRSAIVEGSLSYGTVCWGG